MTRLTSSIFVIASNLISIAVTVGTFIIFNKLNGTFDLFVTIISSIFSTIIIFSISINSLLIIFKRLDEKEEKERKKNKQKREKREQ